MTSQPSTGFEDQAQHRLQSISTSKNTEKPSMRQEKELAHPCRKSTASALPSLISPPLALRGKRPYSDKRPQGWKAALFRAFTKPITF